MIRLFLIALALQLGPVVWLIAIPPALFIAACVVSFFGARLS